jgi:c-di-GMP-binding flagellar brake protein YcgR
MLLKVGTIIVIDKDNTEEGDKYKSKVVDYGEGFLMIDYPTHIGTGRSAFFMDGTQLMITFTTETKSSFAFRTSVSGRLNKGIPMLKLDYPGDENIIKIQRREFVRVDSEIDVAVELEGIYTQFVAEDISAGGMALNLSANEVIKENDTILMTIVLPFSNKEIKYIKAEAKVVRIWEKDGKNIASCKFEKIPEIARQYIVRFSFERQLQIRNNQ